jgi:hypothetical protein
MKTEKLYTVVLDYLGGTYIAQVQASSPAAALPKMGVENQGRRSGGMGDTSKTAC